MHKSSILVSPNTVTHSNENLYFQTNIMHRYLTYVYDSTYFHGTFFNDVNYKHLGRTPEQQQQT